MSRFDEKYDSVMEAMGRYGLDVFAVASIGNQDLNTGKNKWFNMLEDWADGEWTAVVIEEQGWDAPTGKTAAIFGSGIGYDDMIGKSMPLSVSGRETRDKWKAVKTIKGAKGIEQLLADVKKYFKKNKIRAYVFK